MVAITVAVLHVIHGATVAFLEAVTEFATIAFVDWGMFVHLMVVGIGVTAVHIVAASSFHTFSEALALGISIAVGSPIPVAITILVLIRILRSAILRSARRGCFLRGGLDCCGRSYADSKSGN